MSVRSPTTRSVRGSDVSHVAVHVAGLSGSRPSRYKGAGKSCLCHRFIHPSEADYVKEHSSVLSLAEFESEVILGEHSVYWGSRVLAFRGKKKAECKARIELIEHTEFLQDVTSKSFMSKDKRAYVERVVYGNISPGKRSFSSLDNLLDSSSAGLASPSQINQLPRILIFVVDCCAIQCLTEYFKNQLKCLEDILLCRKKQKCKTEVVVAATKCDQIDQARFNELDQMVKKYKLTVFQVSSESNLNITELFTFTVSKLLNLKILESSKSIKPAATQLVHSKSLKRQGLRDYLSKRVLTVNMTYAEVEVSEEMKDSKALLGCAEPLGIFREHILLLFVRSSQASSTCTVDNIEQFVESHPDLRADKGNMLRFAMRILGSKKDPDLSIQVVHTPPNLSHSPSLTSKSQDIDSGFDTDSHMTYLSNVDGTEADCSSSEDESSNATPSHTPTNVTFSTFSPPNATANIIRQPHLVATPPAVKESPLPPQPLPPEQCHFQFPASSQANCVSVSEPVSSSLSEGAGSSNSTFQTLNVPTLNIKASDILTHKTFHVPKTSNQVPTMKAVSIPSVPTSLPQPNQQDATETSSLEESARKAAKPKQSSPIPPLRRYSPGPSTPTATRHSIKRQPNLKTRPRIQSPPLPVVFNTPSDPTQSPKANRSPFVQPLNPSPPAPVHPPGPTPTSGLIPELYDEIDDLNAALNSKTQTTEAVNPLYSEKKDINSSPIPKQKELTQTVQLPQEHSKSGISIKELKSKFKESHFSPIKPVKREVFNPEPVPQVPPRCYGDPDVEEPVPPPKLFDPSEMFQDTLSQSSISDGSTASPEVPPRRFSPTDGRVSPDRPEGLQKCTLSGEEEIDVERRIDERPPMPIPGQGQLNTSKSIPCPQGSPKPSQIQKSTTLPRSFRPLPNLPFASTSPEDIPPHFSKEYSEIGDILPEHLMKGYENRGSQRNTSKQPVPAPSVRQPSPEPCHRQLLLAPSVRQPTPEPCRRQPAPAPSVRQPAPAPSVRQPAPAPSVRQPAPAPSVRQPSPAPSVRQPAPAPSVRQPAPAPSVRQPAPAPSVRQPSTVPVNRQALTRRQTCNVPVEQQTENFTDMSTYQNVFAPAPTIPSRDGERRIKKITATPPDLPPKSTMAQSPKLPPKHKSTSESSKAPYDYVKDFVPWRFLPASRLDVPPRRATALPQTFIDPPGRQAMQSLLQFRNQINQKGSSADPSDDLDYEHMVSPQYPPSPKQVYIAEKHIVYGQLSRTATVGSEGGYVPVEEPFVDKFSSSLEVFSQDYVPMTNPEILEQVKHRKAKEGSLYYNVHKPSSTKAQSLELEDLYYNVHKVKNPLAHLNIDIIPPRPPKMQRPPVAMPRTRMTTSSQPRPPPIPPKSEGIVQARNEISHPTPVHPVQQGSNTHPRLQHQDQIFSGVFNDASVSPDCGRQFGYQPLSPVHHVSSAPFENHQLHMPEVPALPPKPLCATNSYSLPSKSKGGKLPPRNIQRNGDYNVSPLPYFSPVL